MVHDLSQDLAPFISFAIAAHVGITIGRLILPEWASKSRVVAGSIGITAAVGWPEAVAFDAVALSGLLAVGETVLVRGLYERRLGVGYGRRRRCHVIRLMAGASGEQGKG